MFYESGAPSKARPVPSAAICRAGIEAWTTGHGITCFFTRCRATVYALDDDSNAPSLTSHKVNHCASLA